MDKRGMFDMKKGWVAGILNLILCLVLIFSVAGVAVTGSASADEEGLIYPIMHPDRETREEWIEAYNSAPRVYMGVEAFQVPSPRGSLSLLDHLEYTPAERNQGDCGNCWAWAGTGCLGIALHVQEGIKDRLSMQYLNSNYSGGTGDNYACCGGSLEHLANFYTTTDMAIPWSNTNASWQDGSQQCGQSTTVPGSTISTTPNYPITSIQAVTIPTQTVGQATAIANIKNVLNQNEAVSFAFFLPTDAAWSDFQSFWDTSGESVVYDMDQFCGIPYTQSGGGHGVLCVGYNDGDPNNSYWIMLNSWGTGLTNNRPNGLFRIDMDMAYDCDNSGYSFFWQTLDVSFDVGGGAPDITVAPTSFEVTLPPDITQDYTLNIGNVGGAALSYNISDTETGGGSTAGGENLLLKPASTVLEIPLEPSPVEPLNTPEASSGWQSIMADGFEGAFPGIWDVHRSSGYTDAYWGKDDSNPCNGSYSAFCAKNGIGRVDPPADYPNNVKAWMIYGPFSLADASDAELNFYYWLDTEEGYDYLRWQASIDGSWFYGWQTSGDSGGWVSQSFDLTDVYTLGNLCGEPQVWIAFTFESDYTFTDKGAFIDDVVLRQYVAAANNPPNTPSNPSPAHEATGVSVNADLSWIGGDPDAGDTVTYDVLFGTSPTPPLVSNDQSATTYDPGTLNNNTKYYWNIVATDNHAAPTSGPAWDFTTGGAAEDCPWLSENPTSGTIAAANPADSITITISTADLTPGNDYSAEIVISNNDPDENPTIVPVTLHVSSGNSEPNIPSDPLPPNHAPNVSIPANLSWTGGDPDASDTVTYDVYFGTSSPPPLKETIGPYPATQSSITYNPGTLSYNTKYYWYIVATDNHSASTTGPLWDFTTGLPGPTVTWDLRWGLDADPAAVNIWLYPEDAVQGTLVGVEWSMPDGLLIWHYGGPIDGWRFYKKGWGASNTLATLAPGDGYIGIVPTASVWEIPQV